jgi:hypothetical protein
MLCVNYYYNGKLFSRRFDFGSLAEARREAELYNQSFYGLGCGRFAQVGYYTDI